MEQENLTDILTEQDALALEKSIENRITTESNISSSAIAESTETQAWWTVQNAMTISAITLIFGIIVIMIGAYLVRKGSEIEGVLRLLATIVILVGSLFLVVAGYTETQVAPVIGLLGTIAGYLLGKARTEQSSQT